MKLLRFNSEMLIRIFIGLTCLTLGYALPVRDVGKVASFATAVSVVGVGVYNVYKITRNKKIYRWELQKPLLLEIVRLVDLLVPLAKKVSDIQFELAHPDLLDGNGTSKNDSDSTCSLHVTIGQELRKKLEEVIAFWTDFFPEYFVSEVQSYIDGQDELMNEFQMSLDDIGYELSQKDVELVVRLRDAVKKVNLDILKDIS